VSAERDRYRAQAVQSRWHAIAAGCSEAGRQLNKIRSLWHQQLTCKVSASRLRIVCSFAHLSAVALFGGVFCI
jgi:hypothetical protein